MVTKEDLKQEIEQLDSSYLELVFNLLKQLPHHHKTKPDALICSRAIDYTNKSDDNELAFTDVTDAGNFGKQLRTERENSWSNDKPNKPLKLGLFKGQIKMADDFNEPLPDSFWLDGKL